MGNSLPLIIMLKGGVPTSISIVNVVELPCGTDAGTGGLFINVFGSITGVG